MFETDLKKNGGFAVLVLIAGVQGSGRGESVNLLNEWRRYCEADNKYFARIKVLRTICEALEAKLD